MIIQKPYRILQIEEKEKIINNIEKILEAWYSHPEIWEMTWIDKQVLRNIKSKWLDISLSLDKAKDYNSKLENIISKLENNGCNI